LNCSVGGACSCKVGYTGLKCNECDATYFAASGVSGVNPSCASCNCYSIGSENHNCSVISGQCNCNSAYSGSKCSSCSPSYYPISGVDGINPVCVSCGCHSLGSNNTLCDSNGVCQCNEGYTGTKCDVCLASFYKTSAQECVPCLCHQIGSNNENCTGITGVCSCELGYQGQKCNYCAPSHSVSSGTNGVDPVCSGCSCNVFGATTCSSIEGGCICLTGYQGTECRDCIPSYFAIEGVQGHYPNCSNCSCSPIGALNETCSDIEGNCYCKEEYSGKTCNACSSESYLVSSDPMICSLCNCNPSGSTSASCDNLGQCSCLNGYAGQKCDICQIDHFQVGGLCQSCNCEENGSFNASCISGECFCLPGYKGTTCNSCKDGYHQNEPLYGDSKCRKCECSSYGSLNQNCDEDGNCTCKPEYTGLHCDSCNVAHYQVSFNPEDGCQPCSCSSNSSSNSCLEDGSCLCPEGYTGRTCDSCGDFYQNANCQQSVCNPIGTLEESGAGCVCKPGYSGDHCNECLSSTIVKFTDGIFVECLYGPCYKYGIESYTDNICNCKPGFTGKRCERCTANAYPSFIDNELVCNPDSCSFGNRLLFAGTIEGKCPCKNGYKQPHCSSCDQYSNNEFGSCAPKFNGPWMKDIKSIDSITQEITDKINSIKTAVDTLQYKNPDEFVACHKILATNPNVCLGHGRCLGATCDCDRGYTGNSCDDRKIKGVYTKGTNYFNRRLSGKPIASDGHIYNNTFDKIFGYKNMLVAFADNDIYISGEVPFFNAGLQGMNSRLLHQFKKGDQNLNQFGSKISSLNYVKLGCIVHLMNNSLLAFGSNEEGQLGFPKSLQMISSPTEISSDEFNPLSDSIDWIYSKDTSVYIKLNNNQMIVWGNNQYSTLVNVSNIYRVFEPKKINPYYNIVKLARSTDAILFIDDLGNAYTLGRNTDYNLGIPSSSTDTINRSGYQVGSNCVDLSSTDTSFSMICNGIAQFWGRNINNHMGIFQTISETPQAAIVPNGCKNVYSSNTHSVILLEDGSVYVTGLVKYNIFPHQNFMEGSFKLFTKVKEVNSTDVVLGDYSIAMLDSSSSIQAFGKTTFYGQSEQEITEEFSRIPKNELFGQTSQMKTLYGTNMYYKDIHLSRQATFFLARELYFVGNEQYTSSSSYIPKTLVSDSNIKQILPMRNTLIYRTNTLYKAIGQNGYGEGIVGHSNILSTTTQCNIPSSQVLTNTFNLLKFGGAYISKTYQIMLFGKTHIDNVVHTLTTPFVFSYNNSAIDVVNMHYNEDAMVIVSLNRQVYIHVKNPDSFDAFSILSPIDKKFNLSSILSPTFGKPKSAVSFSLSFKVGVAILMESGQVYGLGSNNYHMLSPSYDVSHVFYSPILMGESITNLKSFTTELVMFNEGEIKFSGRHFYTKQANGTFTSQSIGIPEDEGIVDVLFSNQTFIVLSA